MKTIQFLFVLVLAALRLDAQQSLLIFFEASEKRPFYVKMGSKTSASSATGQVYFTDLSEKKYEIYIGFPDADPAEHRFEVTLARADNSFQLTPTPNGKWTLIDLETNKVLSELDQVAPETFTLRGVRKTDAFAIMMAGVVNDSAVLYTSVPPAPPVVASQAVVTVKDREDSQPIIVKWDTLLVDTAVARAGVEPVAEAHIQGDSAAQRQQAADSSVAQRQQAADSSVAIATVPAVVPPDSAALPQKEIVSDSARVVRTEDVAVTTPVPATDSMKAVANMKVPTSNVNTSTTAGPKPIAAGISKFGERRTANQLELSYADSNNGKTDTIRIVIASEPELKAEPAVKNPDTVTKSDFAPVKWSANPRPLSAPSDTNSGKSSPVMINSDCVNFASEYDLDKLRVKMVNEVTADERIAAARKVFKTKCFTSRQIRALTELFLNDEGRFQFLESAYPFVSDSDGFRKLSDVLTDEVYIKRFNALVR